MLSLTGQFKKFGSACTCYPQRISLVFAQCHTSHTIPGMDYQISNILTLIDALIDSSVVRIHHGSNISTNHSYYCITGSATLHIIRNMCFSKIDTLVFARCHIGCTIPLDIKYFDFGKGS